MMLNDGPTSNYPFESITFEILENMKCKAEDSVYIADCVRRLSDFYIANPTKQTPWTETWCKVAYLRYFLPLNWWRVRKAYSRLESLNGFWQPFLHCVDFGSGLGTSLLALNPAVRSKFVSILSCEVSKEAILLQKKILSSGSGNLSPQYSFQSHEPSHQSIKPKTLAIFSYSLTELESLPSWALSCDGLFLIEPSTRQDSLKLITFRRQLLQAGWKILAPCTHEAQCPFEDSVHGDWCHDRTEWVRPSWFEKLEKNLPMKNGTLSFSYLVAVRSEIAQQYTTVNFLTPSFQRARLTGDLQKFKGHSKQLICRGSEREFLSFQEKHFPKNQSPCLPRGDLVELGLNIKKVANELRVADSSQLIHLKESV